ncbi:DUF3168 domain-containing protein [Paraburkholderia sacchari]|uniref:DUF3168 domain-containing protein n=1 Tax=Paraburkholderia sacchari TaxID=159450 RepID=UPI001BCDC9C5|nr:DUF3168 domain-containing protein [Paraburkholderia sacchari]
MASAEQLTRDVLLPLFPRRVFADQVDGNVPPPYAVFQAVGGVDETTFDGLSDVQNSRMQVTVWTASRLEAAELMQGVLKVMTAGPVRAKPLGAPVSVRDIETGFRGSRVDFSIWFRPA